ncbi:hypothetical protein SERLA73DRAFT_173994, partial [Serpula lacrymans var. lacrymans S7.3]
MGQTSSSSSLQYECGDPSNGGPSTMQHHSQESASDCLDNVDDLMADSLFTQGLSNMSQHDCMEQTEALHQYKDGKDAATYISTYRLC